MHAKMPGGLLAGFLLLLVPTQGFGLDLPRSGHPIFDRVVTLVADNFTIPQRSTALAQRYGRNSMAATR